VARDGKPVVEQVFRGLHSTCGQYQIGVQNESSMRWSGWRWIADDPRREPAILPLLAGRARPLDPKVVPSRSIICSRCARGWNGPRAPEYGPLGDEPQLGQLHR